MNSGSSVSLAFFLGHILLSTPHAEVLLCPDPATPFPGPQEVLCSPEHLLGIPLQGLQTVCPRVPSPLFIPTMPVTPASELMRLVVK